MRTITAGLAGLALTLGTAGSALADEIRKGEELHGANCISCHADMVGGDGSALYTRDNRMVGSHGDLVAQIRNCDANLGTNWFDDEIEAVAAFLNDAYYDF